MVGDRKLRGAADEQPGPLQKEADAAAWTWKDENASLYHAFQNYHGDYQVAIVKPTNRFGQLNVVFSKDGKTIYDADAQTRDLVAEYAARAVALTEFPLAQH